jgi:hypothetical protein
MATGKYDHWVMGRGLPPGHPDLLDEEDEELPGPDEPQVSDRDIELWVTAMRLLDEIAEREDPTPFVPPFLRDDPPPGRGSPQQPSGPGRAP